MLKKDIYTVSEFAGLAGVTIQTLRNWDKSGKLKPAQHTKGGNRLYNFKQLLELKGGQGERDKSAIYYVDNKNIDALNRIKQSLDFSNERYDIYVDKNIFGDEFNRLIKQVGLGKYNKIAINEKNLALGINELNLLRDVLAALQVILILM